jgi:hypothetical protein
MFINLAQNQIQLMLYPMVELYFHAHDTFFSMIANISLLRNISVDDDIALTLQKRYKN